MNSTYKLPSCDPLSFAQGSASVRLSTAMVPLSWNVRIYCGGKPGISLDEHLPNEGSFKEILRELQKSELEQDEGTSPWNLLTCCGGYVCFWIYVNTCGCTFWGGGRLGKNQMWFGFVFILNSS